MIACGTFVQAQDAVQNTGIATGHIVAVQDANSISPQNEQLSPAVRDIDGNQYSTVIIGKQVWMAENLRVTKYNDGTPVTLVKDAAMWAHNFKARPKPAMSWYDNDHVKYQADKYGALYNWYVLSPATNGNRNVCPVDWHVPSDEEWTIMENFLIKNSHNFDSTSQGDRSTNNKIAKSLSSASGWSIDDGVGAVGNTDYISIRNKSGFNALPAGYRGYDGTFINIKKYGYWWSATQAGNSSAWGRNISYSNNFVDAFNKNKAYGYSIRCVRN